MTHLFLRRIVVAFVAQTVVMTIAFAPITSAYAARVSTGSTMLPQTIEVAGDPGETVRTTLKVKNTSDVSRTYSIFVNTLYAETESGNAIFGPIMPNDLSGWIKIMPNTLILEPDREEMLDVTINIPRFATPGGHDAAIFAMSAAGKGIGGFETNSQRAIGSFLFRTYAFG